MDKYIKKYQIFLESRGDSKNLDEVVEIYLKNCSKWNLKSDKKNIQR